ncbi:MAG: hypothetical protein HeimC2_06580 [Candidatus Heimdallarchaeota archaeon LC_2]|nr:MAG: hypothetical protein HeimC2_06580 [Candidatus Heimdallarchaeota archaeon LC_2]
MSDLYSEPVELFFHKDSGKDMAETAFNVAAQLYNLEVEKFENDDYLVGFFKLKDPKTQLSRGPTLFKQGLNLIRTLTHYRKDAISEPEPTTKVNIKDLKDALDVINAFH